MDEEDPHAAQLPFDPSKPQPPDPPPVEPKRYVVKILGAEKEYKGETQPVSRLIIYTYTLDILPDVELGSLYEVWFNKLPPGSPYPPEGIS